MKKLYALLLLLLLPISAHADLKGVITHPTETNGGFTTGNCVKFSNTGTSDPVFQDAGFPCGNGTGSGNVTGPASSTDSAITRFDGLTGLLLKNSTVTISDSGAFTGASIDTASAANVIKVNGTSLTAVSGTGAVALINTPVFTTPNIGNATGNITGNAGTATTATSAAKWTTARNLAGNSVDGTGNVAFANAFIVKGTADSGLSGAQFLGALSTGIVKNTTTTGVLSIAVAGDFPTLNQNTTGSAASLTTGRTISITGDLAYTSPSFDGTGNVTAAGTLATVNSNVGTFGSATKTVTVAATGKGLITAISEQTVTPAVGSVTGFGTGVATALGVNVGTAGAFVVNGGALGTPSSGTATNLSGTAASLTAGTVTTNANLTGPVTSVGNATSIASSIALPGSPTTTTQAPADNSTKVSTTAYVDNAVLGQRQKEAVKYASTAALPASVYANGASGVGATLTEVGLGALSLDGSTPSTSDRVLIKNQASTFQNGIYTVTTVGSGAAVFVLTRATDFDQSSDIQTGDSVFVTAGSTLSSTTWAYTGVDSPTMGTDALTFVQAAGPGSYTAGNGITITGTSIAINTAVTADLSTAQALTNKDLSGAGNSFPTFNQNTTGSAAKWTTARNLAGNSVDGSANVAFANKFIVQGTTDAGLSAAQFTGALATGIVKNTTTTGVLSIAVAGDFPTLNQNTTGSAATLTTARNIGGVSFDGSAAITVATATGGFTVSGGDLALGANNLTMTGSLGATGARLTKGWFADLQVTNAIAGSITGLAGTATALESARTLWGQSFDGTGNITGSLTSVGDITGGASNMTITSGTGNSRTLVLRTTTSGGTATTALTLGADQAATFAGAVSVTGHTTFEGVTSTGATGTGKLVYDGTPTLVTPVIGAATGTSVALTALSKISAATGAAALPTVQTGVLFQMGNADSTADGFQLDAFAATPTIWGERAQGTIASKTAVTGATSLLNINGAGYDGSAYSARQVGIQLATGANTWGVSDHGTTISFVGTPDASTTAAVWATFANSNLKIGGTAARGTTEGTAHIDCFNGTAPVGTLTNGASIYCASGAVLAMDSTGQATVVSSTKSAPAISATKSANFTVLTYTPASAVGQYVVSGVITTTSSTNTGTVQLTVDYVDSQGTTHTADVIPLVDAAGSVAATKTGASKEFHSVPYDITINNAGSNIVLKAVITGTVSYTVTGYVKQIF